MEDLDRGLVSVRSGSNNLVSWRLLGTEAQGIGFNVYRAGTKLNSTPITASTNYLDPGAAANASYTVRAVVDGAEQGDSPASLSFANGDLDVRMQVPAGGTTPDGMAYTYSADDASIADADGDGRDEIMYGAAAIDDNGSLLWRSGLGHGDSLHVGDLIPSRAGLEVYRPSESTSQPTDAMLAARTGARIWTHASCGCDNGRGVAGDIYAGSAGAEAWSSSVDGLSNTSGQNVGRKPSSTNFLIRWDGDPVRELLDQTRIDKYGTGGDTRLLTASGVSSNNTTKATPALSGDLFGDWREEVVWRLSDSRAVSP
ncbi:hypothetical protein M1L60_07950 [Actinoplanes sp. TRM 88003]|uniref:Rhamnogalacturonan I lyase beta-sheet domain-containing protein n=1 Tax=Paractinoplanes aksuensis TaxID=2939490 RepID=A0ABT1DI74_9ACTN|nr:hypothetical protein [Actinoplanes aksuensis]MCO8270528.1 hypothetical protein [Actinoplanes aksuensis]